MSARRIRKPIAALAVVAGAIAVWSPVAQASASDAFERALKNHPLQQQPFLGSPDAIDRALAAKDAERLAAIDLRERGLTERPSDSTTPPDAFERALVSHAAALHAHTVSMLNARERALGERPAVSSPVSVTAAQGFDWGDFAMGASAGIGLVLIAGLGAVAIRRSQRVTTA